MFFPRCIVTMKLFHYEKIKIRRLLQNTLESGMVLLISKIFLCIKLFWPYFEGSITAL